MTACTQPRCTGTIFDGYCDVCGSPVGAAPFVPADSSEGSPTADGEPGACTQPGCTGSIIDGYCDVCGSPAGAIPFVAATSAVSSGPARTAGLTAASAPIPARAPVEEEEIPTQRLPRVSAAEPDRSQDYRTRVEEAQLPDDVREAALSTKAPDWMDIEGSREVESTLQRLIEPATVADLEEGDTAEVEAVAEVEEGDTAEVEPAADVEEGDTAEVEPAADLGEGHTAVADIEKADTTPGSHNRDTVETPAVLGVISEGGHTPPQLTEQQVPGPVLVQTPEEKRRYRSLALAAIALAALLIGALVFFFGARRDGSVPAESTPTVTANATATVSNPTSEQSDASTGLEGAESTIKLSDLPDSARPFETVRIRGTYRGGSDTFLHLQRWEGGEWLTFPVPAKTNHAGQFTAHVLLEQPGRYRLRLLDPDSGATSKTFVLLIEG